jgi:ABC-type bacteriocin/lantibiotic exporter with double-glycine peptidase domain
MLPICLQHFPVDQVLSLWFSRLPLKDDFDEVRTILKTLVYLGQTLDLSAYAERSLEVLFDAILTHTVQADKYKINDELWRQVLALTVSFRSHSSFQVVGSRLSGEQQQVLSQVLA